MLTFAQAIFYGTLGDGELQMSFFFKVLYFDVT